ncbi:MAG: type III secretion system chaperone [Sutterella sp.]
MQSHFERLVESLAADYGTAVTRSEDGLDWTVEAGAFLLMFSYLADAGQMLVSTCVAELPAEGRERLYFRLLNGQYFFRETAGATLAVDPEERFVTLQLVRHLSGLTPENFPQLAEHFLQAALLWRSRIETAESAPQTSADSEADLSGPYPFSMLSV